MNVFRTGDAIAKTGTTIPGSVGFTYARIGNIPSNGKHAKKTKPSAEDGIELRQLQDFSNKPEKWLEKYK